MHIADFADHLSFVLAWKAEQPRSRCQRVLARRLGLTCSGIGAVVLGQRPIAVDAAPAWADALLLSPAERA